jgi:hypothetical protein
MAQNTTLQMSATTTAAAAIRCSADIRRIEGAIKAGGWPWPEWLWW